MLRRCFFVRAVNEVYLDYYMREEELKNVIQGDVLVDDATRAHYSRDASIFEVTPSFVVFPKDAEDVKHLVKLVSEAKEKGDNVSLTARSAGTDMGGGPLTESIVMDFTKYFKKISEVSVENNEGYITSEPGVFYRDFEKETLKSGYLLPSYPASRSLCAIGGIVANDSGGEKTLKYGKTHDYVERLNVVLSDGELHEIKALTPQELAAKEALHTFEGEIYRKMHALLETNYDVVHAAKPNVSKNSAGYDLWNVWDRTRFDLTKLFVGSQGTLGIVTEAEFRLVKTKPHSGMLVIFLKDFDSIIPVVKEVLPFKPSSFESFDDKTFKLALKFLWGFIKILAKNPFSLAFSFLPEFFLVLTKGMPKLILLAEFEEDTEEAVVTKIDELRKKLLPLHLPMRVAKTKEESDKYWAIRRESFNLLRQRVRGMQAAPFVDDIIVRPEFIPEFLPKLYQILDKYEFFSTVAGHMGDGNFHIIPLLKLANESDRAKIHPAMDEVYTLVLSYGGSITAEHNDGLIRSPYLTQMFGEKVTNLFAEVKTIFDPHGIFNPGKKVGASIEYAMAHIKKS